MATNERVLGAGLRDGDRWAWRGGGASRGQPMGGPLGVGLAMVANGSVGGVGGAGLMG